MNEINQIINEPVRKSRILLVDDEPGLRTAVKTFLEDEGFEIFIAVSYTHLTLPTRIFV